MSMFSSFLFDFARRYGSKSLPSDITLLTVIIAYRLYTLKFDGSGKTPQRVNCDSP